MKIEKLSRPMAGAVFLRGDRERTEVPMHMRILYIFYLEKSLIP